MKLATVTLGERATAPPLIATAPADDDARDVDRDDDASRPTPEGISEGERNELVAKSFFAGSFSSLKASSDAAERAAISFPVLPFPSLSSSFWPPPLPPLLRPRFLSEKETECLIFFVDVDDEEIDRVSPLTDSELAFE